MKFFELSLLFIFFYNWNIAQGFKVNADEIKGLTVTREQKMKLAVKIFEKVMNDSAFQKEVAAFAYEYDKPGDPNSHSTAQQVADKIFAGSEFYNPSNDSVANIHWIIQKKKKPWFARHPAVGYGEPMGIPIYTYTWFFDHSDLPDIAGHIAHEWSHKIGFDHLFDPHPGRDNTVPYAFGYIVRKYAKKYID